MKLTLLLFVAGAVAGITLTLGFVIPYNRGLEREVRKGAAEAAQRHQAELAAVEQRVAKLETTNAKLTADLEAARSNATRQVARATRSTRSAGGNPWAAMFGGGESNKFGGAMSGLMKAAMSQQVESQIAALKLRLKLSEAQESGVRGILDKQYGAAGDMATRMFQGKLDTNELARAGSSLGDTRAQINALLTPEQQVAYAAYLEDQRQTSAAMMANVEVAQMQTSLQLDADQQQKVYNIIYDQTLKVIPADGAGAGRHWGDLQKHEDDKLEALRAVLTPDQFAAYEKQVTAKRQMMNSFMQSFGGGTNGNISVGVEVHSAGD